MYRCLYKFHMLIIFTGFALVDILVYFINNNLCGDNTHLIADMLFSDRNQFSTSTCRAITVLFRDIQNDNIAFCLGKVKLLLRTLFRAFVCLNRRSSFSGLRRGFPSTSSNRDIWSGLGNIILVRSDLDAQRSLRIEAFSSFRRAISYL